MRQHLHLVVQILVRRIVRRIARPSNISVTFSSWEMHLQVWQVISQLLGENIVGPAAETIALTTSGRTETHRDICTGNCSDSKESKRRILCPAVAWSQDLVWLPSPERFQLSLDEDEIGNQDAAQANPFVDTDIDGFSAETY